MKLGPYLYHPNTYNIPDNEGVNEWASGGHYQKTTRQCHEIKKMSTLTNLKPVYKPDFFTAIHNHLTLALM